MTPRFTAEEFYSSEGDFPWCVVDHYQVGSDGERLILGRFSTESDAENCVQAIHEALTPGKPGTIFVG